MILNRTLPIVPTSFACAGKFKTPSYKLFISLLLITPLLIVSCAHPSAVPGNRAPLVYVAVGDSTGIGLGARNGGGYVDRLFARIAQQRSGSTLINLSAAGATTADALNKQIPQLTGTQATLVTICIGQNDLLRGREAQKFAEDYETLVAKLKQPGRRIVIANLPDVASAPAMKGMADEHFRLRLGQYNQAIEDIARRHGVPMVDLYQLGGEINSSRPEYFSSDGLHPSDLGYAHWAEAMWPVVDRAIHE